MRILHAAHLLLTLALIVVLALLWADYAAQVERIETLERAELDRSIEALAGQIGDLERLADKASAKGK